MKTKQSTKPQHTPTPWSLIYTEAISGNKLIDSFQILDAKGYTTVCAGLNRKDGDLIFRAVNSHEALLEIAKDSLAIIKRLADKNGMFFDDRDNQMGLEGKLIQAIAQAEQGGN